MNTNQEIQKTVAFFAKCEPDALKEGTSLAPSALGGSIMLHRLYAELAKQGVRVENPAEISNYGQLLEAIGDKGSPVEASSVIVPSELGHSAKGGLGIDIVELSKFPVVDDYREDSFYKENFSPKEIAYCILQGDPIASFAGKFAAKEALVKADGRFQKTPFNQIEILNDEKAKPYIGGPYAISISHADNYATAVAIKEQGTITNEIDEPEAMTAVCDKLIKARMRGLWLKIFGLSAVLIIVCYSILK